MHGHQAWRRSFGLQDFSLDSGRGAFHGRRSRTVRYGGAHGSENVGMSNDKTGEKPVRRKPKGSCSTLIGTGLVGS